MELIRWLLLMVYVVIVRAEPKVYNILKLHLSEIYKLSTVLSDQYYDQCKSLSTEYIKNHLRKYMPVQHELYVVSKKNNADAFCTCYNMDFFCAMHLSEEYETAKRTDTSFKPPVFLKQLPSPYYFPPGSTSMFEIVGVKSQPWHLQVSQIAIPNFDKRLEPAFKPLIKNDIFFCPLLLSTEQLLPNGDTKTYVLLNYHRYGANIFELLRQFAGSITIYGFTNNNKPFTYKVVNSVRCLDGIFGHWTRPIEKGILFDGTGDGTINVEFIGFEDPGNTLEQLITRKFYPLLRSQH